MPSQMTTLAGLLVSIALLQAAPARAEIEMLVEEPLPVAPAAPVAVDTAPDPEPLPEPTLAQVVDHGDVLTLVNGDTLHGTLGSADPDDYGLRWIHRDAAAPIDFALEAVARVQLARRPTPRHQGNRPARVELTNDDLLRGRLVAVNDTLVTLDTWYAGQLAIARPMVAALEPNTGASAVPYEGPVDLTSWTIHQSGRHAWTLRKGALVGSTSYAIGRTIDAMPDAASFTFDVAWQYRYPSFYFTFFSDNLSDHGGNCYGLRFSGSSARLYRFSRTQGSHSFGDVNIPELMNKRQARIRVLADRRQHSVALLVDGRLVQRWTDNAAVMQTGNGIVFDPDSEYPMKIWNIRVAAWDGDIPSPDANRVEASEEDVIRFINHDKVSGTLASIAGEQATFATSYATLDIPLARAARIDMASSRAARARRNAGDVRAHFTSEGAITVALTAIDGQVITGTTENAGTVTMPLGAFDLIEFNIYREQDEDPAGLFDF